MSVIGKYRFPYNIIISFFMQNVKGDFLGGLLSLKTRFLIFTLYFFILFKIYCKPIDFCGGMAYRNVKQSVLLHLYPTNIMRVMI